ncbi:hypothetical protein O6H91_13G084000 [Diphasiastrum complanatum]|uniref:Uncharacterized protein n=1 Tax=Diphasiastrum complanatum TaxID=34168 RepID=A0ACC2BX72_DIPCM|nr:hypothetical protein O6H91_13G084000 [Diphasiastrum complanatum]
MHCYADAFEQVLPWLSPQDLALVACTCSHLARAVAAITRHRLSDAAQGLERCPVPILNTVDACLYPYFHYSPFCRPAASISRRFAWGSSGSSCLNFLECKRICEDEARRNLQLVHGFQNAGCCCSVCGSHNLGIEHDTNDAAAPLATNLQACAQDIGEVTRCQDPKMLDASTFFLGSPFGPQETRNSRFSGRNVEHSGSAIYTRRVILEDFGHNSDDATINYVNGLPCQASACPCGRMIGGELAYDEDSRLQLLTKKRMSDKFHKEHDQHCSKSDPSVQHRCLKEQWKFVDKKDASSNQSKPLNMPYDLEEGPPLIFECGVLCSCSSNCRYRVLQHGLAVPVIVKRHCSKGWGLHAGKPIKQGAFVCEYSGELVTIAESRRRQKTYDTVGSGKRKCGSALLILREHLPSGKASLRVNIDATEVGNVARFINHSCDGGNLLPCLVRSAGSFFPKLGLFARRNIQEMEELSFRYGSRNEGPHSPACFCGSLSCQDM